MLKPENEKETMYVKLLSGIFIPDLNGKHSIYSLSDGATKSKGEQISSHKINLTDAAMS